MKKLYNILCLAITFFLSNRLQAQGVANLEAYPARTINRIMQLNRQFKLSSRQQTDIAAYLWHLDSLANSSKLQAIRSNKLQSFFPDDNELFEKFLTFPEFVEFKIVYQGNSNTSEAAKAIAYRRRLQLNEDQISQLIKKVREAKLGINDVDVNTKPTRLSDLKNILTPTELRLYFTFTNEQRALQKTTDDWTLLKSSGLVSAPDSGKICSELYNFQLASFACLDYNRAYNIAQNLKAVTDSIEAHKPMILHKVDVMSGEYIPLSLFMAFRFKEDLRLSAVQYTQILDKLTFFKYQRAKQNIVTTALSDQQKHQSSIAVKTILSTDQYLLFWQLIERAPAKIFMADCWGQLKDSGLTDSRDSVRLCNQIYTFKLNQLIALDTTKTGLVKRVSDSIWHFSNINKPYLLWKLDMANDKLPTTYFSEILSYRIKIKLSPVQIDTLLDNAITYERRKAQFALQYPGQYLNYVQLQNDVIKRTLSDEQLELFLPLRNYNNAFYKADKDWDALQKAGLISASTNKKKVMEENQAYELKLCVAMEKEAIYRTQSSTQFRQSIENRKPELLNKLYELNNVAASNKRTKDAFAW